MPLHHLALATADMDRTHAFYTHAMGFDLVKVVMAASPEGGWAKHYFYDMGGGELMAFWDLRMPGVVDQVKGAISRDLGMPEWVNHVAFDAPDDDAYARARDRFTNLGLDIAEIDHEFCRSIYTLDPNRTLVEWCQTLRSFTAEEAAHAHAALSMDEPDVWDASKEPVFITGDRSLRPAWAAGL